MPRATSLAAELEREFQVKASLEKGDAGVFDVVVDGDTIFSKHETGRFPDDGEVLALMKA